MRGTPEIGHHARHTPGIIPAHAGNTKPESQTAITARDHPRTCGEHRVYVRQLLVVSGSSPHMRGTLSSMLSPSRVPGIIPAHAGNTRCPRCGCRWWWDHPRTCGEHCSSHCARLPSVGSSPHMRGTPEFFARLPDVLGIIPAHAGNTRSVICGGLEYGDHPRTCGEHVKPIAVYGSDAGSSPHMRGTHS